MPFFDRLIEWSVERRHRLMQAQVDGNAGLARRTVLMIPVKWIVGFAAFVGLTTLSDDSWWQTACAVVVGVIIGGSGMRSLERQQAYTWGWREGRLRAFDSLRESQQRGHTVEDWLIGEIERDQGQVW